MENFIYNTPTKLIFGKGVISKLPDVLGEKGKKVLFTYGGESIKKSGLYGKIKELLSGFEVYELARIEPNPKYNSVLEGVKICKEKNIDVVLAVGGGSVIDCSKAICAGALYSGEPWDLIVGKVKTENALPLVDVLTLAATGSEYDAAAVISRTETDDKVGYKDPHLYPYASFVDPEYTYTVSKRQTAAGVADAINHVMEQYFCASHSLLTDGLCEAVIRSLIKNGRIALDNPENYEARAEVAVCCSLACNGILSVGTVRSGWPCHAMEHALSAYYDITHGEGLAIITPRWMERILCDETLERFVSFGQNIFGISEEDDWKTAKATVKAVYNLFESFSMPMHLAEVGIDNTRLKEMAHHVAEKEHLENAWYPLYEKDIEEIFEKSV